MQTIWAMIGDKKQELQESVGAMEGDVQEARTDNEPGEDRRDVCFDIRERT